jgi:hypothetical protein
MTTYDQRFGGLATKKLKKRKILPAVLIGVTISGIIVSLIVHFGIQGLDFMIKHIEVAK